MFDVYVKVNIITAVIALILDNWTHMRQSPTLRQGIEIDGNDTCRMWFIAIRDRFMSKKQLDASPALK